MTTKRGKKDGHFLSSLPFHVAVKKFLLLLRFVSFVRRMTLIHGLRCLAMADLSRICVFLLFLINLLGLIGDCP